MCQGIYSSTLYISIPAYESMKIYVKGKFYFGTDYPTDEMFNGVFIHGYRFLVYVPNEFMKWEKNNKLFVCLFNFYLYICRN